MKLANSVNITADRKASGRAGKAGINREGLLGITLIVVVFVALFYLFTRTSSAPDNAPETGETRGFRSVLVSEGLSLKEVAENWNYYSTMTSVCHRAGQEMTSAAYAYLFYAFDRHSQNGKWSHREFTRAVDASERYYNIDPVRDCKPDANNLHGLDVSDDLWLKTRALNYVFYSKKAQVCKNAGNRVQARMYSHMVESEREKLDRVKWDPSRVNAAISDARISPDLSKITGC
jgi:hypothetical protein